MILEEDAKKIRKRRAYNILPMEEDGVSNPFSYFPEVATSQSCSIHFLARFVSACMVIGMKQGSGLALFLARRICIHVSMMTWTDWDLWVIVSR